MSIFRKKHASNDDLLEELRTLKTQVELLQEQTQNKSASANYEKGVEFLLAEFKELGQFWRHTDSRMESALNLYMTASALIVSGLVYLSQQVTDFRAFLSFVTLITVALFVGGMILANRILGTALIKAEYIRALNLIRRYFVDTDQSIRDYLLLPIANSPKDTARPLGKGFSARIPTSLLVVIHVWDSLLLGFVVGSISWLAEPRILLIAIFAIGAVVAVLCFAVLSILARRKRGAG